jgi:hypothetical protein
MRNLAKRWINLKILRPLVPKTEATQEVNCRNGKILHKMNTRTDSLGSKTKSNARTAFGNSGRCGGLLVKKQVEMIIGTVECGRYLLHFRGQFLPQFDGRNIGKAGSPEALAPSLETVRNCITENLNPCSIMRILAVS